MVTGEARRWWLLWQQRSTRSPDTSMVTVNTTWPPRHGVDGPVHGSGLTVGCIQAGRGPRRGGREENSGLPVRHHLARTTNSASITCRQYESAHELLLQGPLVSRLSASRQYPHRRSPRRSSSRAAEDDVDSIARPLHRPAAQRDVHFESGERAHLPFDRRRDPCAEEIAASKASIRPGTWNSRT